MGVRRTVLSFFFSYENKEIQVGYSSPKFPYVLWLNNYAESQRIANSMEWNYEGHWRRCPNSSEDKIPVGRLTAPTGGVGCQWFPLTRTDARKHNNLKHTDLGPNPLLGLRHPNVPLGHVTQALQIHLYSMNVSECEPHKRSHLCRLPGASKKAIAIFIFSLQFMLSSDLI